MRRSSSSKPEKLRRLVDWLRTNYPTPHPVKVTLTRLPGRSIHRVDGITSRSGKRLYVQIDNRLTWGEMIDTMVHEWAHCMDWRHSSLERHREAIHSDEWGLYLARIYRHLHDFEAIIK